MDIIYYLIVYISFFYSVYLALLKKNAQNYFFVYYFLVIVCDILLAKVFKENGLLSLVIYFLLSMCFFSFYFYRNLKGKKQKIILLSVFTIVFILSIIFQVSIGVKKYSIFFLLSVSFFYIFLSSLWFYESFIDMDEKTLYSKQAFWISTAILFWGVFFIFRTIPMYYFNLHDLEFLKVIAKIFTVVNILTYLFIFRGLLCKQ